MLTKTDSLRGGGKLQQNLNELSEEELKTLINQINEQIFKIENDKLNKIKSSQDYQHILTLITNKIQHMKDISKLDREIFDVKKKIAEDNNMSWTEIINLVYNDELTLRKEKGLYNQEKEN